jgi:hypothetical protein
MRFPHRPEGGEWQHEDYDVFDGERDAGRIFLDASQTWFWGVSFQLTGRKSYGHTPTLDEAKVAFRTEYEVWMGTGAGRQVGVMDGSSPL